MTLFYAAAIYALLRYSTCSTRLGVTHCDRLSNRALSQRWEGHSAWSIPLQPEYEKVLGPIGWAFAIGALTGLAFMAKEVAAILLAIVFVAMLVTKHFRIVDSIVVMGASATVSPHLLALRLGRASEGGGGWAEYVIWQMARPANHPIGFYLSNVFVYLACRCWCSCASESGWQCAGLARTRRWQHS